METKTNTIYLATAFFAVACFALSPRARAVSPPPDGGYVNQNTAEGTDALFSLKTGSNNTALGFDALYNNIDGSLNTAIGASALLSNEGGVFNTGTGSSALYSNTDGSSNTATGANSLLFNTGGGFNTATGSFALFSNIDGSKNTATGGSALYSNTHGYENTAGGVFALYYNTIGYDDTANGFQALLNNTSGNDNTATGYDALGNNTTGDNNTANGFQALYNNTTGSFNIAVGNGAGGNLTTGINNIDIGNNGVAGESKTIRIGKQGTQRTTFIAGISGTTVPTGIPVIVDSTGHLGTTTSSARYKEAIHPMERTSETILALKPVVFRYKHDLDPAGSPQFGLVAEEVEKVDPRLVACDEQGKPYTVRYDAVNAMLLNEFLKEHKAFVEERHKVRELEANAVRQQKQIEVLTAGLQKVSAQIAVTKPAPQVVNNP